MLPPAPRWPQRARRGKVVAMRRAIRGFRTDDVGDWVAVLSCGHPQHVRHQPPFQERPWVTTEEGRRGKLGQPLDCVRCDACELPADAELYRATEVFTEASMPRALAHRHATREGVWGRIVVLSGRLRYVCAALRIDDELAPDRPGVVVPEVEHRVEPLGAVRFRVELHRSPPPA
jgi:tellurite methyltransferase